MKKRLVIRKSVNMEGKGDNTTLESLQKKTGISSEELKKQHAMGMKVEAEHTKDIKVAHQIAMDHMEEDVYYYKKLKESGLADELEKSKNLIIKKSAIDWSDRLRRLFIRKHGSYEENQQLETEDKERKYQKVTGNPKFITHSQLRKMSLLANGSTEYDRKYKLQGRVNWNGLNIAIENKKGSYRTGKDIDGKPWKTLMSYDYGRITGTKATDSENVDIFIGPDDTADRVYVVHQVDPFKNYAYDECKVMANFPSKETAIKGYQSQYNRPDFLGEVSEFTIPEFKQALIDNRGKMLYRSPILLESKDDKRPKRLIVRRKS